MDVTTTGGMECSSAYTWYRIKQDGKRECSRLDKIFVSGEGFWLNPPFRFCVDYTTVCSDHAPILFSWNMHACIETKGQIVFKLNISHLKDRLFMMEVRKAWSTVDDAHPACRFD